MSTEINTSLRGRSLSVEVMPYRFSEFRLAHQLTPPKPPFGKQAYKDMYFYRTQEGYEVDFVTIDANGEREIIQTTWDMTDHKTAEREQRALEQAQKELGIKGRIITHRDYAVEGV